MSRPLPPLTLLISIFYLLQISSVDAQFFHWAGILPGNPNQDGTEIMVDKNGNIYVTGACGDNADLDPGPGFYEPISSGTYIVKLNSQGKFIWGKTFRGNSSPGTDIAIAQDG